MSIEKLVNHLKQKKLNNTEIETVLLFAAGFHASEIAKIRFVTAKTIKGHITFIRKKLGCHETNGVLKYALNFLIPNISQETLNFLYPKKYEKPLSVGNNKLNL